MVELEVRGLYNISKMSFYTAVLQFDMCLPE